MYRAVGWFILFLGLTVLSFSSYAANRLVLNQRMTMPVLKPDEFKQMSARYDAQGVHHVRMQQYYQGIPILGGNMIVHYLHHKTWMNGVIYQNLASELGEQPSAYVSNQTQVLDKIKGMYRQYPLVDEAIHPVIYIDDEHLAHWAYQVELWVQPTDAIPRHPTVIVDALSFDELLAWDKVKTVRSYVKGQGYGGNLNTGLIHYGVDKPALPLTRDAATGRCYLDNYRVTVFDMAGGYGPQGSPAAFACPTASDVYWTGKGGDGYDKVNEAFSPSNDALYIGQVIRDLYVTWYGVEPLGRGLTITPLIMRVHYGQQYENAFWDGSQMTFGDGGHTFYPLVSLSIGAHEISHGFTEHHSDLAYVGQSGGINESFSDMASQAAQFYVDGMNNWLIGAEVIKEKGVNLALRYMDRPSLDGYSIERANEYRRGMDVHHSSGVFNRLFYLMTQKKGFNTRTAFQVMVKANMDYWVPHSTFQDAACGVIWAAMDLDFPIEPISEAFNTIAIETKQC